MAVKVININRIGNILFSRNPRSRRIRLRVSAEAKVSVSYPYGVSLAEAVRFAEAHTSWIIRQRRKLEAIQPLFPENREISTRYHKIIVYPKGENTTLKQNGFNIEILYPAKLTIEHPEVQGHIRKVMTEIYRWEARHYLPGRLKELAALHHFKYARVTIRNNRSNWGSCSGRNNISLNLKLMTLPDHLIDYILLHELAHTEVKNHGEEFWKLLDSLTGNRARELLSEVRKHSVHSL
ncbi:MAG: SprT family zinc-dependent metalloprotease [Prolixibacteraceae bacterium]|jgi:hypothetical protein|nr:M48 family metallopeptidase [Prolixibacteraceae bacterium]MDI9563441.1 SprT family zinc-dependent metalloprotease [Bacteroidota bacterium]NLS98559.1 M48 family metallopeptidase [Bacteroidales bacterium]OQB80262.1 MAG: WLM domain protein [Bacteroidetes bacterium ADurb.Bin123]HNU78183.1 SprT family zinc-dependent metalloprotease [Prolixibacteraceae bacterium]